jgi:hypothetical protein
MAGLRDGLQRSQKLSVPEPDAARDVTVKAPPGRTRSLPQRVRNIGFSVRGSDRQSAWKRRFRRGTIAPTETAPHRTLLIRCALLHGLGGILLAGATTVLFLESSGKSWFWLILLALLIAIYGVAAYWLAEHFERLSLARWVVLGGDLTALAWGWLLLGPSVVFYLLLPSLVLLAVFLSDRRDMLLVACMEAMMLVGLEIADLAGLAHLQLHVPAVIVLLLTLSGSLACLGWIVWALLTLLNRNEQIGAADHWSSAEVARVRIESDIHLRQLQDGVATLQGVLARVAGGELHARVAIKDEELAPIAAKVNSLLERQERMFDEAQQHRRLEAAVGELLALLEALHRGERVGWPAPTGTPVDRILALMRAPLQPRTTTRLPAAHAGGARAPEDALSPTPDPR